jgi:anaerobic ribonucleoside-triphosphate reductase
MKDQQNQDVVCCALPERTRCEVWTRVMGYHRPISHFNTGKREEFRQRVCFNERACENSKFMKDFS